MSLAPKPDQELAKTFHQWAKHGAQAEQMASLAYARALSQLNLRPSSLGLSRLRELNELAASKTSHTLDQLDQQTKFRHYLCFCAFFEALVEAQKLKQRLSVISLNPEAVNLKRCAVFKIGESRFMPIALWLSPWPAGDFDQQTSSGASATADIYLPSKQFESEQSIQPKVLLNSESVHSKTPTERAIPIEPKADEPPAAKAPQPEADHEALNQVQTLRTQSVATPDTQSSWVSDPQGRTSDSVQNIEPAVIAEFIDPSAARDSTAARSGSATISRSASSTQRFALQPRPYLLAAALPVFFLLLQIKHIGALWLAGFQIGNLVSPLIWTSIWILLCLIIVGFYLSSKIELFATKAARQSWFGSSQAFFDTDPQFVHTRELTALGPMTQTLIKTRHEYLLLRAARPQALIHALNQLEEEHFFPAALAQIENGQTLEFESLVLTHDTLSYGNQITALHEIAHFKYDLEWVEVTLKNGNRFARIPAAAVYSVYRLKLLIQSLSS